MSTILLGVRQSLLFGQTAMHPALNRSAIGKQVIRLKLLHTFTLSVVNSLKNLLQIASIPLKGLLVIKNKPLLQKPIYVTLWKTAYYHRIPMMTKTLPSGTKRMRPITTLIHKSLLAP